MEQLRSEDSKYTYSNSKNNFSARKRTKSVIMTRPTQESDEDSNQQYDYR